MCCSPSIPTPPGPTPQETELQQLQLEQYKKSIAEDEALRRAVEGATGRPYSETMAELTKTSLDINAAAADRYRKSMAGELDLDPTLERSLKEQEQTLRSTMLRQLGPGWETSTPGQQALAEYRKRAEEIRQSARRGEISAAEQQGYALNPASWVPGIAPKTATPNAANLLAEYRMGRQGDYNAQLNAYQLSQMGQSPWEALFGVGRGAGAGALMGAGKMLGKGMGGWSGAGLGALLAI